MFRPLSTSQNQSQDDRPYSNKFQAHEKEILDEIRVTADTLLHQTLSAQWQYVPTDKDGTQMRKDNSYLSASYRLMRVHSLLLCQSHELAHLFAHQTTQSWRSLLRSCLQKHYIDTLLIQQDGACSIKWVAVDTPNGRRELSIVDYFSESEDSDSMSFWVCQSLPSAVCLGPNQCYVRGFGIFWKCVAHDRVEIYACGSVPSEYSHLIGGILSSTIRSIQQQIEKLRLCSSLLERRVSWIENTQRKNCSLCTRNFYALRRRHHCRRCGEIVCAECSMIESTDLPVLGTVKLRLCKPCYIEATRTPLQNTLGHSRSFHEKDLGMKHSIDLSPAKAFGTLETNPSSNMLDLLCELACQTLHCPIAYVSLWKDGEKLESSLKDTFVKKELEIVMNALLDLGPMVILDAMENKRVQLAFFNTGTALHKIRFFAGCPIKDESKHVGYICVCDYEKRDSLGASCAFSMQRLASLAMRTIDKRKSNQEKYDTEEDSMESKMQKLLLQSMDTQRLANVQPLDRIILR